MTFYVRGHPIGWLSVYSVIVSTISGMTFGYDMVRLSNRSVYRMSACGDSL